MTGKAKTLNAYIVEVPCRQLTESRCGRIFFQGDRSAYRNRAISSCFECTPSFA